MNIEITENDLIFNGVVINNRLDIALLLKTEARKIAIDKQSKLFILDDEGIRYWREDNVNVEVQICLNEHNKNEFFPKSDCHNLILINNIAIDWQTKINQEIIGNLNLSIDDDNLRFKVLTYFFKNEEINYSITLNNEYLIKHISISFQNNQR